MSSTFLHDEMVKAFLKPSTKSYIFLQLTNYGGRTGIFCTDEDLKYAFNIKC